jgi:SH3-like domain-containing protein
MRALFLLALLAAPAAAQAPEPDDGTSGLPVPRFVSIKAGKAFVRTGPADRYPVIWVYVRKGLPVEVIKEYEIWRQIRDESGAVGWINKSLLQSERTAIVTRGVRTLYSRADLSSPPVWRIEAGALVSLVLCEGDWCRVARAGKGGYILRSQLWGSYPGERIEG